MSFGQRFDRWNKTARQNFSAWRDSASQTMKTHMEDFKKKVGMETTTMEEALHTFPLEIMGKTRVVESELFNSGALVNVLTSAFQNLTAQQAAISQGKIRDTDTMIAQLMVDGDVLKKDYAAAHGEIALQGSAIADELEQRGLKPFRSLVTPNWTDVVKAAANDTRKDVFRRIDGITGDVKATELDKRAQSEKLTNATIAAIQAMISGPDGGESVVSALRAQAADANLTEAIAGEMRRAWETDGALFASLSKSLDDLSMAGRSAVEGGTVGVLGGLGADVASFRADGQAAAAGLRAEDRRTVESFRALTERLANSLLARYGAVEQGILNFHGVRKDLARRAAEASGNLSAFGESASSWGASELLAAGDWKKKSTAQLTELEKAERQLWARATASYDAADSELQARAGGLTENGTREILDVSSRRAGLFAALAREGEGLLLDEAGGIANLVGAAGSPAEGAALCLF